MSREVSVRTATPEDRLAVHRLVDGAMLAVENLDGRLDAGDVLLAVRATTSDRTDGTDGVGTTGGEHPLGTLVCEPIDGGWEIVAVAVRRAHRDRGIGTALVEAAREREERLVAEFDPSVRPFYESLGFSIRPVDGVDGPGTGRSCGDGATDGEKRYRGALSS